MIMKLMAVFSKEWRLLWRDKIGLIFLFILPMCLVLFITLTSSQEPNRPRQLKLVLINQDSQGNVSKALVTGLKKIKNFTISESPNNNVTTLSSAQKSVAAGDYQAVIIIPAQFSKQTNDKVQQNIQPRTTQTAGPADIQILFDPALPKNFQDDIASALRLLSQAIELQLWQQVISQLTSKPAPAVDTDKAGIITIHTDYVPAADSQSALQPNDVQQNVPAWALFGMFFIITPLSGMIVKEKRLGVMDRVALAPVSLHTVIWGKIIAFVCVNLLQLALMLAVGVFILPLLHFPTLDVTSHPGPYWPLASPLL